LAFAIFLKQMMIINFIMVKLFFQIRQRIKNTIFGFNNFATLKARTMDFCCLIDFALRIQIIGYVFTTVIYLGIELVIDQNFNRFRLNLPTRFGKDPKNGGKNEIPEQ